MDQVSHALSVLSQDLLHALLIVAVLTLVVGVCVTWWRSRTDQLVINELTDSTGDPAVAGITLGLTHLARQRIDHEIVVVSQRRDSLHQLLVPPAAKARTGGGPSFLRRDPAPQRLGDRIDDSLAQLLTAARDVAPEPARPAVQVLTMLASRPRGLLLTGAIQRRGQASRPRLGISVDVSHLDGNRSIASETFWEPTDPEPAEPDDRLPGERVVQLLGPASRWVAVQLVIHTVFPAGAAKTEAGLDHLLSGLLLTQSVAAFALQSTTFRRCAAQELREAVRSVDESPRTLAALADTFDRLAASDGNPGLYLEAHEQYDRALAAIGSSVPVDAALVERYEVRRATSWLASQLPQQVARARSWLTSHPPVIPQGCAPGDVYDAACLYALASEAFGSDEPNPLRDEAIGLLVRALLADQTPQHQLSALARTDPQLSSLKPYLPAVMSKVSEATPTS